MHYPRRLTERIWLLGNHYFSTYLITGDKSAALIEAGISGSAPTVIEQIESSEMDASRIETLLITHAHADHLGGGPVLKDRLPGLRVVASSETARLIGKEKIRRVFIKDDGDTCRQLQRMGIIDRPVAVNSLRADLIDETIAPGQVMDLGGIAIQAVDAPGHCPGGLAFLEPEGKVLFCSDYLGFILPPDAFLPNFYVDFDDYMKTFDTLAALKPDWVCPAHCGVYRGNAAVNFIAGSRNEIEWIHRRVTEHDASPAGDDDPLVAALFQRYYIREATMFSEQLTRYCLQLLIRRIRNAATQ